MDDLTVNICSILEGHPRGMREGLLIVCLLGDFKRFKALKGWHLLQHRSKVLTALNRLKWAGKAKKRSGRWYYVPVEVIA